MISKYVVLLLVVCVVRAEDDVGTRLDSTVVVADPAAKPVDDQLAVESSPPVEQVKAVDSPAEATVAQQAGTATGDQPKQIAEMLEAGLFGALIAGAEAGEGHHHHHHHGASGYYPGGGYPGQYPYYPMNGGYPYGPYAPNGPYPGGFYPKYYGFYGPQEFYPRDRPFFNPYFGVQQQPSFYPSFFAGHFDSGRFQLAQKKQQLQNKPYNVLVNDDVLAAITGGKASQFRGGPIAGYLAKPPGAGKFRSDDQQPTDEEIVQSGPFVYLYPEDHESWSLPSKEN